MGVYHRRSLENGFPEGEHVGRIGLDISPSNPAVVYAIYDNRSYP